MFEPKQILLRDIRLAVLLQGEGIVAHRVRCAAHLCLSEGDSSDGDHTVPHRIGILLVYLTCGN